MNYMIMVYETEAAFRARSDEKKSAYWGAYKAYTQALREAGVLAGGHPLQPTFSATTGSCSSGPDRSPEAPQPTMTCSRVTMTGGGLEARTWARSPTAARYSGVLPAARSSSTESNQSSAAAS